MWAVPIILLLFFLLLKTSNKSIDRKLRPWSRTINIDKVKVSAHRLSPLGLHLFIPVQNTAGSKTFWRVAEKAPETCKGFEEFKKELSSEGVSEVSYLQDGNWFSFYLPGFGIPEDKMNRAARLLVKCFEMMCQTSGLTPKPSANIFMKEGSNLKSDPT